MPLPTSVTLAAIRVLTSLAASALRQIAHLTRPLRFNRCIERQGVRLERDAIDHANDVVDAAR